MTPNQLTVRACRLRRTASAVRAHAISARLATPEAATHEEESAECLEALADKLGRQAMRLSEGDASSPGAPLPPRRGGRARGKP
jgi:hypothetical protein